MTSAGVATVSVPRSVTRLVGHHGRWFVAGALAWLTFHLWPLVPGLLGKWFFDALSGQPVLGGGVATIVGLMAAAGLARIAIILSAHVTAPRWRFAAQALTQRNIVDRQLRRPGAQFSGHGTGGLVSTLRDDTRAMAMMGDWVFDTISAVVFGVSGLAIMLAVDVKVTLLVAVPLAVVAGLAHLARNGLERLRHRNREHSSALSQLLGDFFAASMVIGLAGAHDQVAERVRRKNVERRRHAMRDEALSQTVDAAFSSISSLGAGLVLLVALGQMRAGSFTVGDFVLFSTYLLQVTSYMGFIGYLARSRRQAQVAFARTAELAGGSSDDVVAGPPLELRRPLQVPGPVSDLHPLASLSVSGLTRQHDGGGGVVDVDLEVRRGAATVIVGSIGAGKTTLLRCVLGQLTPESGAVLWNGQPITDPGTQLIDPRVGYTPQLPGLFSATLRENVLLSRTEVDRLAEAIEAGGLAEEVARMPQGLDTEIGVGGTRVSGGQQTRVAVARMLLRAPDLVVLDEVASALDHETATRLWRVLRDESRTVLAVTHHPWMMRSADWVVVLREGRVVAQGPPTEVEAACEDFRTLLGAPGPEPIPATAPTTT